MDTNSAQKCHVLQTSTRPNAKGAIAHSTHLSVTVEMRPVSLAVSQVPGLAACFMSAALRSPEATRLERLCSRGASGCSRSVVFVCKAEEKQTNSSLHSLAPWPGLSSKTVAVSLPGGLETSTKSSPPVFPVMVGFGTNH